VYHLAASPDYVRKHGAPEVPDDLNRHHCLVYRGSSGPNRWLLRGGRGVDTLSRDAIDDLE
jgi:DNA-binding transcriptional LysR family regulator